jgi:endo-1,4-beta-D-glucanase Y
MRVCSLAFVLIVVGCAAPQTPDPSGTGNTGGSAPVPVPCGPQAQPPASGGANFPFPQHRLSPNCGYPTNCNDADVMTAWAVYKQKMIVSDGGSRLRVQRLENSNDIVSEGIAYGMLFAVYMNDKPTFDGIWAYAQAHFRSDTRLMSWHLNADGSFNNSGGDGSQNATDADEDMAFALVMAERQWGGYQAAATAMINAIMQYEVDGSNVLKPGNNFGGSNETNPSYFAPAYYRVFAQVTGNTRWMQVIDTSYTVLEACANDQTGLVPDWCNASGQALRNSIYSFDATRTPFRIAQDACWNNEARAISYVNRVATFFDGVGPTNIKNGYQLDGTATGTFLIPSFAGPAAVSGMPGSHSNLMLQIYGLVSGVIKGGTSSSYNYYNASWGLMSVMMMTGNFVVF